MDTRRRGAVPDALAAATLAALAAIYQLFFTPDFLNDHFMHVAWARQMLAGEWPVRDFFEPGMPLTDLVSAAAERVVGYRLLSEGLVVSLSVGIAVLLTTWTTARLTRRTISGIFAGLFVAFTFTRSYSYPKVLLYAIVVWLAAGYVRKPGRAKLLALGVLAALGFWFRHDHGLLIGAAVVVLLVAVHRTQWRPLAVFSATAVGLSLPYVLYAMVQSGGALAYWQSSLEFVTGEAAKSSPLAVPAWPLRTRADWVLAGREPLRLGVRWIEGSSAADREAAETALGLRAIERDGRSGRYLLDDPTPARMRAVVNDPRVEDTAGIDRGTGRPADLWTFLGEYVPLTRVRVLPGVANPSGAAAALFYVFAALPIALVVLTAVLRRPDWPLVVFSVALSVLTSLAFLRDPLPARIGDAAVAPAVIFGIVVAQLLAVGSGTKERSAWSRAILAARGEKPRRHSSDDASPLAALLLHQIWLDILSRRALPSGRLVALGARRAFHHGLLTRALTAVFAVAIIWVAANVGIVPRRIDIVLGGGDWHRAREEWRERWWQMRVSPPLAGLSKSDRASSVIARYLFACTPPDSRVFVGGFAPDIYYFADRRFAGRVAFVLSGFWQSPVDQLAIRQALDKQPPVVIVSTGRDGTWMPIGFEEISHWIEERYQPFGEIRDQGRLFRLLAPKDAAPERTYDGQHWPCFAS